MNRAERVYAFLREHEGIYIEAVRFEPIGGRQAWRTAISEARALATADGYDIDNRTRKQTHEGREWTLSEYALVKRTRNTAPEMYDANAAWGLSAPEGR